MDTAKYKEGKEKVVCVFITFIHRKPNRLNLEVIYYIYVTYTYVPILYVRICKDLI